MNNNLSKFLCAVALAGGSCAAASAQVKIDIDAGQRGAAIGKLHYGIFFEEINHAGDGGLYAELVQNRSFEDDDSAPVHWTAIGGASVSLFSGGVTDCHKHSLMLAMSAPGDGVRNDGFWGMNIEKGKDYAFSVWVNNSSGWRGKLSVNLEASDGSNLGAAVIDLRKAVETKGAWQKYKATVTATGNCPNGAMSLTGSKKGSLLIDMVSLFPPTFKGRENGCRIDLAEKLEAMHPAFMRFPGGCYVEGQTRNGLQNRFEWKKTIGPLEERPGHYNVNWSYNVSDGLGFHEMLQLAEDIGAEPLFVVNVGIGHGWVQDYNDIGEYIQEALDAIEYCNGDVTTEWGAKRAANGHPAPFNLRLLEIGNENYNFTSDDNRDQSDHYAERYKAFYDAIKAQYPGMTLIGNVEAWSTDEPSWRNPHPVDALDEHYYRSPAWFVSKYNKYDGYDRSKPKVYVGEYAVTQGFGVNGHLTAALGEAVYMLGMEKNSDVCIMNSYAPIFVNENDQKWRPDMIRFNSSESYGTPSYYVQKLMSTNVGAENVKWTEEGNVRTAAGEGGFGLSTWRTRARFDNLRVTDASGKVILADSFDKMGSHWKQDGGAWTVKDGALEQSGEPAQGNILSCDMKAGDKYTLEVDATKTGGEEGFLIVFNYKDADNYTWWNIGGWNNSSNGVEVCRDGGRSTVASDRGHIETGRTYHAKVTVDGKHIVCSLDGKVVHDFTLPEEQKLYVATSISKAEDTLLVKIVNPTAEPTVAKVSVANAKFSGGRVIVLSSAKGTDENSLAAQDNVVPTESELTLPVGSAFDYAAPAYSLSILKLAVSDVKKGGQ